MVDAWFKPKRYGYGATPANWKGWAATIGFIVLMVILSLALVARPGLTGGEPETWHIAVWFIGICVLTLGFVAFCRYKTDGAWHWRWGKEN